MIIGIGARLYNKPAKVAALKDFILRGVILSEKFPAASNQLRILKGYLLVKRAGATASCGISFHPRRPDGLLQELRPPVRARPSPRPARALYTNTTHPLTVSHVEGRQAASAYARCRQVLC